MIVNLALFRSFSFPLYTLTFCFWIVFSSNYSVENIQMGPNQMPSGGNECYSRNLIIRPSIVNLTLWWEWSQRTANWGRSILPTWLGVSTTLLAILFIISYFISFPATACDNLKNPHRPYPTLFLHDQNLQHKSRHLPHIFTGRNELVLNVRSI